MTPICMCAHKSARCNLRIHSQSSYSCDAEPTNHNRKGLPVLNQKTETTCQHTAHAMKKRWRDARECLLPIFSFPPYPQASPQHASAQFRETWLYHLEYLGHSGPRPTNTNGSGPSDGAQSRKQCIVHQRVCGRSTCYKLRRVRGQEA